MDPIALYTLYAVFCKKPRKKRRWSVHPINRVRLQSGVFNTLFNELKGDSDKFFNYFRMSQSSFDELSTIVRTQIQEDSSLVAGLSFLPEEMIALTLRFLATGCTYAELHYTFRVGITTASIIIQKMCVTMWLALYTRVFVKLDDEDTWRQIANDYMVNCNFPHCLGAIDGKHVRIVNPQHSGSLYYNYKNYFSIVLMAVADSQYKFIYINVGSYGREADPTIFSETSFGKKLEEESLNLPKPCKISADIPPLPYVFVADEAFGLTQNLMRPYGGNNLTARERIYNYRHCRARRCVECAFGILSNKWRIFHKAMACDVGLAVSIVKVCCALHNFVRDRDGVRFDDTLEISGLYENDIAEVRHPRGKRKAYKIRDYFANYFTSPSGAVPWQTNFI